MTETPKPPAPVLFELDGKKLTPEQYDVEFRRLGDKLRAAPPAAEPAPPAPPAKR